MDKSTAALVSLTQADHILWFDTASRTFTLTYKSRPVISGTLGMTVTGYPVVTWEDKTCVVTWSNAILRLTEHDCGFRAEWIGDPDEVLEEQFSLASGGHWVGGGELVRQGYPLETLQWELAPYQAWDNGPTGLGGVLHPVWFASSGAMIAVDPECQFSVGLNAPRTAPPERIWQMAVNTDVPLLLPLPDDGEGDGLFRLHAEPQSGERARLAYTVTSHPNPVEAQQAFLETIPHPRATPPLEMFRDPIWTTWARFKMGIDQRGTLKYADEIIEHDFPYSVMEIDDKWSRAYGDFAFDPIKFPDPKRMVDELHDKGFRVTLWVTPFAAENSEAFIEGLAEGFWVAGASDEAEPIRWWQGEGYALDVTNERAVAWYLERLRQLQTEFGIDGFKFDAGEPCFLPKNCRTHQPIAPNDYTTLWVERVASQFEWAEVRSAYRNQAAPIFVREWDRHSSWGVDNGLESIVTAAITFGLMGYPFVLPDMVGGNAYGSLLPDEELLIRWTQANALLPAMQFSIAPWDFDEETTEMCRRAVRWHTNHSEIYPLAIAATQNGHPIIRPISWLSPDDPFTYAIGDQFALGDSTMVAPVMQAGARTRDFYLPAGTWRDVLRNETLEGGKWVRDYPAPLDYLPWFERL